MMTTKTYLSIVLAMVAGYLSHLAGKPWWVDHPLGGDVFDVTLFSFLAIRGSLALFDNGVRPE
jgi:hypothetical protein